MTYRYEYVTFLSDYGLTDEFVGVCHGVMLRIAPGLRIIDITHGIKPQNVREGAMVLAQSVRYMPPAVHLAVVDPGVGSDRLPIVIKARDGSALVGPDNGLLAMAAARLGGIEAAHVITNKELMLEGPSRTFHGRDLFAPAAAHIAKGVPVEEFGEPVPSEKLVSQAIKEPRRHDDHYHAVILHIDRFGNLQLNLTSKHLVEIGLTLGSMLEVRIEGHRKLVPYAEMFASVPVTDPVVTEDSYGLLAVAVNHGSAAEMFGASHESNVILGPPGSGAAD